MTEVEGAARQRRWTWLKQLFKGWGLLALAVGAVAGSAALRNRWLVTVACGLLAVTGIAFEGELGRRSTRARLRLAMALVLMALGAGFVLWWSKGGRPEGWGFIGVVTLLFGFFQLLALLRDNRALAPARGVVLVGGGAIAVAAGLLGPGPDGPAIGGWLVLGGVLAVILGVPLLSEDFLRALSAAAPPRWMLAVLAGGGALLLVPAIAALNRLGAPMGYALLVALALTIAVGSLASRSDADVIIVVIATMLAWSLLPRDSPALHFQTGGKHVLVSFGDSYVSGEGAKSFYEGTNTKDKNQCRRAPTAYSPLLASTGNPQRFDSVLFLACSGAVASDIVDTSQHTQDPLPDLIPPRGDGKGMSQLAQYDALQRATPFHPDLVLVGIGGNDAGFANLVQACVGPGDCAQTGQKWLDGLSTVAANVAKAYEQIRIRFPQTPVLAVPYPIQLTSDGCAASLLSADEHRFLAAFVGQLNVVIRHAAEKVHFEFVDTVPAAMEGIRICEGKLKDAGVNFFAANPVGGLLESSVDPQNWIHDSFHPNKRGHDRLETTVAGWIKAHSPLPPVAGPDRDGQGQYAVARIEDVMGDPAFPNCASAKAKSDFCHFDDKQQLEMGRWNRAQALAMIRRISIPVAGLSVGAWLLWVAAIGLWRRTSWWRRTKKAIWRPLARVGRSLRRRKQPAG